MPNSEKIENTSKPNKYEGFQKLVVGSYESDDGYEEFKSLNKKARKQWAIISENLRREIPNNPDLKNTLKLFIARPVQESFSKDLINDLKSLSPTPVITKILNLLQKYEEFNYIINLDIIESQRIGSNIYNTKTPSSRILFQLNELELNKHQMEEDEYNSQLKDLQEETKTNLLTRSEKKLLATRYKFARDIMMLAFLAATDDNEINIDTNQINSNVGIQGEVNQELLQQYPELQNPTQWKRIQFKDRVYIISTKNNLGEPTKLLLKESKTARHTDTGESNASNSSKVEYEIAQDLQQYNFELKNLGLKVTTEKSLGYIGFPQQKEKYQSMEFGIFEFKDNLISSDKIITELQNKIIQSQDTYKEEFEKANQNLQQYQYDHFNNYYDSNTQKSIKNITKSLSKDIITKEIKQKPLFGKSIDGFIKKLPELSFQEFAQIKAFQMYYTSTSIMRYFSGNLYKNTDFDGFEFRINQSPEGKLELETFLFDYERYEPRSQKPDSFEIYLRQSFQKLSQEPRTAWSINGKVINFTQSQAAAIKYLYDQNIEKLGL